MKSRNQILRHETDPTREQTVFEEQRVKMILNVFKLTEFKWKLLDAEHALTDTRRLTFSRFREMFPTFPVVLDARYFSRIAERVQLVELFRRPHRLFMTDLYLETFARNEAEAAERPIGLVIPFDAYRGGIVVHNGSFGTGGVQLQFDIPGNAPPYRLRAEPFHGFLQYLAVAGWSPTIAGTCGLPTARPEAQTVFGHVAPWMSKQLGTGPGFALFVWLTGILNSASARYKPYIRIGKNGMRYLASSQDELAELTGLSPDALKRGLKQLREQELIVTVRRARKTVIRVILPNDECDISDR